MLVDQMVKNFKELLPCIFKFLQCMTAGSSGMSLSKRMFIWLQISYLKFLSVTCCHHHRQSLSSVVS